MGMVVRSNIMAVNSQRQLGMNNSQVSKSLEKLSSGFRINRAGDDASGLAISEKMKAQIKGLETASSNCQDGISLIQTAEGALTEVHDMLNRMVELCGKAANGTMDSVVDRPALQQEVEQLKDEINRIAKGTNFNGTFLLNGDLTGNVGGAGSVTIDALESGATVKENAATAGTFTSGAAFSTGAAALKDGDKVFMSFSYTDAKGNEKSVDVSLTADLKTGKLIAADGTKYDFGTVTSGTNDYKLTDVQQAEIFAKELGKKVGDTFKVTANTTDKKLEFEAVTPGADTAAKGITYSIDNGTTIKQSAVPANAAGTNASQEFNLTNYAEGEVFTINGQKFAFAKDAAAADTFDKDVNVVIQKATTIGTGDFTNMAALIQQKTGVKATADDAAKKITFEGTAGSTGNGLVLQIGDTAEDYNEMTVSIQNMDAASLGIDGVDISTREGGSAALAMLRNAEGGGAINTVSTVRARLGALQNRLEHTINNLDVAAENMTSANSRIRDTDMAKQMMEYTKMNVLTQSAQAMLAQANQQPQSVLQLLQ